VVERNNHGSGVLALAETACKYGRIYRQGGQAGWLTTSVSRPAMLGQLDAALVEEPERFQSRRLLGECRSFVRLPNGSSGAQAGTHDDRVMAMAIGWRRSGRTSLALQFVAQRTAEERACAWVDVSDAFDPESAAANGVRLKQLLWMRCGSSDQATPSGTNRPLTPRDQGNKGTRNPFGHKLRRERGR
jgi:hypothetical protein